MPSRRSQHASSHSSSQTNHRGRREAAGEQVIDPSINDAYAVPYQQYNPSPDRSWNAAASTGGANSLASMQPEHGSPENSQSLDTFFHQVSSAQPAFNYPRDQVWPSSGFSQSPTSTPNFYVAASNPTASPNVAQHRTQYGVGPQSLIDYSISGDSYASTSETWANSDPRNYGADFGADSQHHGRRWSIRARQGSQVDPSIADQQSGTTRQNGHYADNDGSDDDDESEQIVRVQNVQQWVGRDDHPYLPGSRGYGQGLFLNVVCDD